MQFDYGYTEDDKLGKPYDIHLLKRLYWFAKPYKWMFLSAVVFILLITSIELAVPYLTKIAIDRHIVPQYRTDENSKSVQQRFGEWGTENALLSHSILESADPSVKSDNRKTRKACL